MNEWMNEFLPPLLWGSFSLVSLFSLSLSLSLPFSFSLGSFISAHDSANPAPRKKDSLLSPRSSQGYWFLLILLSFILHVHVSLKTCLHLFLLLPLWPSILSPLLSGFSFLPTTIPLRTTLSKVTSILHLLSQYLLSVYCIWGKAARAWKKSFTSCSPLGAQESINKTSHRKCDKEYWKKAINSLWEWQWSFSCLASPQSGREHFLLLYNPTGKPGGPGKLYLHQQACLIISCFLVSVSRSFYILFHGL